MAEAVYMLCAVMSFLCALMLYRGYRFSKTNLLLWSSVSFALIAAVNMFLFFDMAVVPNLDLNGPFWRNLLGAASGSVLLIGLIWELT
jgi:hypothetical protein